MFRVTAQPAYLRDLSGSAVGHSNVFLSRLRRARLSRGGLSPRKILARRTAAVESAEPLWCSIPGAMGDDGAVSAIADSSAAAAAVVAGFVRPGAFFLRRYGPVFPGAPVGAKPLCCGSGRLGLHVQRFDFVEPDVAEPSDC